MRTLAILGLALVLVAACADGDVGSGGSPQTVAEAFLVLIDQGYYEESWAETAAHVRNNVEADQWSPHIASFREPLGALQHREFNAVEFHDYLDEMPEGEYALVFFDSSFASGRNASEVVGLMLDDDSSWRVIGYQTL